MDESEVRFPVSCPLCAQELLTQMPMTVIERALSVGAAIHLRATCHDVHWEATALEVEQYGSISMPLERRSTWIPSREQRGERQAGRDDERCAGGSNPPQIIELADLETRLPENVVRGGDVEENVRQHVMEQVGSAQHILGGRACLQGDGSVFGALELRRLQRFEIGDGAASRGD